MHTHAYCTKTYQTEPAAETHAGKSVGLKDTASCAATGVAAIRVCTFVRAIVCLGIALVHILACLAAALVSRVAGADGGSANLVGARRLGIAAAVVR